MKKAIIWHNPRCSKSRQTLKLLEELGAEHHVEIDIRKYLVDAPSRDELQFALELLGMKSSELIRKKEKLFKELKLKNADEDALQKAMFENPKLIERPIVFLDNRAILGRPPENVARLFE